MDYVERQNRLRQLVAGQIDANGFEGCENTGDVISLVIDWIENSKELEQDLEFTQDELVDEVCRQLNDSNLWKKAKE